MNLFLQSLIGFIFFVSSHAFAQNYQEIIFGEDNQWIYQKRLLENKALPEIIETHMYPTEELARQAHPTALSDLRSDGPDVLVSEVKNANIWDVKNSWNESWEAKYTQWIETEVDPRFFSKYKIETDCADVAVSLRWIFSRMNFLPAASHLAASSLLFTQDTVKKQWAKLPKSDLWYKDQRFLTALKYLLEFTYTHSLYRDSYPIAIRPDSLTPGAHHLSLHGTSGHTQLVYRVSLKNALEAPVSVMASTVPARVRDLFAEAYWDSDQPQFKTGGFLKMRWPEKVDGKWTLKSAETMPGYSREQYEDKYFSKESGSFGLAVWKRVNPDFDAMAIMHGGVASLQHQLVLRDETVNQGFTACQKVSCAPGTEGYEDWSTPSRDKKIRDSWKDLEAFNDQMEQSNQGIGGNYRELIAKSEVMIGDQKVPLRQLRQVWLYQLFNSDPTVNPEKRWLARANPLADFLTNKMTALLKQRKEKVDASTCFRNQCSSTSELYFKEQTFDIDSELQRLALSAGTFCKVALPEECEIFRRRLDSAFDESTHLNFSEIIQTAPLLNSDPNLDLQHRWGLHFPLSKVSLGEFFQYSSAEDGRLLLTVRGGVRLYDPHLPNFIDIEGSQRIAILHHQLPWFFGYQKTSLTWTDYEKKTHSDIDVGEEILWAAWLGQSQIIVVQGKEKTHFIAVQDDQLKILESELGEAFYIGNSNPILAFVRAREVVVFDFSVQPHRKFVFKDIFSAGVRLVVASRINADFYSLLGYSGAGPESLVFDVQKGNVQATQGFALQEEISNGWFAISVQGKARIARLSPDYKVIESFEVNEGHTVMVDKWRGEKFYLVDTRDDARGFFEFDPKSGMLKSFKLAKDERFISHSGPWILTKSRSSNRLRHFDDPDKILLESTTLGFYQSEFKVPLLISLNEKIPNSFSVFDPAQPTTPILTGPALVWSALVAPGNLSELPFDFFSTNGFTDAESGKAIKAQVEVGAYQTWTSAGLPILRPGQGADLYLSP